MPRLAQATQRGTPYYNIMDHRAEIARKWRETDQLLRFDGVLDPQLKEEVRRELAQYTGCRFCASLGSPRQHHDDVRTAAAVAFAAAVAQNPRSVSDETFDTLREHFGAEEIVELSSWISFMYGAELFGAIMNLDPATEQQKTAYAAWLEQGARQRKARSK
jgi:alkylhydroperoxidase family enzyme